MRRKHRRRCSQKYVGLRHGSKAALGPHEALYRAGEHEKVRLPIRGVPFDDLRGRDFRPGIIQPSVPGIFGILAAGHFDLEAGPHDIGRSTAVSRLGVNVSLGVQMVVGPPKIFKPFFVGAVWPIPPRKA
jgi:hypothetical protein